MAQEAPSNLNYLLKDATRRLILQPLSPRKIWNRDALNVADALGSRAGPTFDNASVAADPTYAGPESELGKPVSSSCFVPEAIFLPQSRKPFLLHPPHLGVYTNRLQITLVITS